jgi:hypothetical protein
MAPLAAQGVGVAAHASILGLGADVGVGLTRMIGLRGGVSVQPWEPKQSFVDVEFTLDSASPSYTAMVDLHPGGDPFRISGGVVVFTWRARGRGTPLEDVEIGDETYTPQQIGTLTRSFDTQDTAPYLGIGFDRVGVGPDRIAASSRPTWRRKSRTSTRTRSRFATIRFCAPGSRSGSEPVGAGRWHGWKRCHTADRDREAARSVGGDRRD